MKKLLAALMIMVMCFAFMGCGGAGDGVLNPDADKEGVTDESWSKEVWDDAVADMISKGYAQKNEEDGVIFTFLDSGVIDLSEEGKAQLESDFKVDGKVIWGAVYATQSETASPIINVHYFPQGEEADESIPTYASDRMVAPTKADVFADTRGQCKYLMLCTALCYNIARDYYIGPRDRLDISTYVFIIDAVSKEVVHVEFINSDRPEAVDSSFMGEIYTDAAYGYMNGLCN